MYTVLVFFPLEVKTKIERKLEILYGDQSNVLYKDIESLLVSYTHSHAIHHLEKSEEGSLKGKYSKGDIILNTYADSIHGDEGTPLEVLNRFSTNFLWEKEILQK